MFLFLCVAGPDDIRGGPRTGGITGFGDQQSSNLQAMIGATRTNEFPGRPGLPGPKGEPFLKITDRKKELLKTSAGKYIAPAPIEIKLKEDSYGYKTGTPENY